jgi:hypothetical protein
VAEAGEARRAEKVIDLTLAVVFGAVGGALIFAGYLRFIGQLARCWPGAC